MLNKPFSCSLFLFFLIERRNDSTKQSQCLHKGDHKCPGTPSLAFMHTKSQLSRSFWYRSALWQTPRRTGRGPCSVTRRLLCCTGKALSGMPMFSGPSSVSLKRENNVLRSLRHGAPSVAGASAHACFFQMVLESAFPNSSVTSS